jgi:hypothetical protein
MPTKKMPDASAVEDRLRDGQWKLARMNNHRVYRRTVIKTTEQTLTLARTPSDGHSNANALKEIEKLNAGVISVCTLSPAACRAIEVADSARSREQGGSSHEEAQLRADLKETQAQLRLQTQQNTEQQKKAVMNMEAMERRVEGERERAEELQAEAEAERKKGDESRFCLRMIAQECLMQEMAAKHEALMQEMAAEHEAYQQRTLDQIRELEREEGLL